MFQTFAVSYALIKISVEAGAMVTAHRDIAELVRPSPSRGLALSEGEC